MNIAVVGAQWGDEGKGKIVDLLAPRFSMVARYAGGHNAGHTVHVSGRKFILRLIPSGILHPGMKCVIGNGVVLDLQALFEEVAELERAGIIVEGRIAISDRAHVILPHHRDLDRLSEAARGDRKIGTTSRGIGPAYEDKIARRGIRTCDLSDPAAIDEHVQRALELRNRLADSDGPTWLEVADRIKELAAKVQPWLTDTSVLLAQAIKDGHAILFEGAQGTMLDIDHGTYPYVTSSSATAGGVCTGLGLGPKHVHGVMGIIKAYTTRVGEGPMPTELLGPEGEDLRARGQEFGAVTGRPRRCGWFDAVVARHAVRVNGIDAFALTKLDVLDGIASIPICTAYRCGGQLVSDFPADLRKLEGCEPVLESMPGWASPTRGAKRNDDLPEAARAYIARLEELTGVPVILVSSGPNRDETIVRNEPLMKEWFGTTTLG
jgi:adenylosuccinate synthase